MGPDRGHADLNRDRMMEFFMESLVLLHGGAPQGGPTGAEERGAGRARQRPLETKGLEA